MLISLENKTSTSRFRLFRSSRLLRVQVRPVRAGGGGPAVPVAARQREPRLPRQDQEREGPPSERDSAPRRHRPDVLQASGQLQASVKITKVL